MRTGIAVDISGLPQDEHAHRYPLHVKVARDHKSVAAIIPMPAQDRYPPFLEVRILLPEETGHLRPGILHQNDTGNTVCLDGEAIELTHFGCCRHSHSTFSLSATVWKHFMPILTGGMLASM